jgi:hypothetical protein
VTTESATRCATHPSVETELTCGKCGKPICPKCLVYTPVGARCRECAQVRRIPTYNMSASTFARAAAGALVGGLAIGVAWWLFNVITFFFFGILAGLAIGYAVGELVSVATNRKAGPPLQAIAVAGVFMAFITRTLLLYVFDGLDADAFRVDIAAVIALAIGCFVAAGRLR